MKIPVTYLSLNSDTPAKGYWDQGVIDDLVNNKLYPPGNKYKLDIVQPNDLKNGGIIIFPARSQVDYIDQLNKYLAKLDWAILVLTGDEEAVFPVDKIKHSNIKIWIMSPHPDKHKADKYGFLGTGYPPQIHQYKLENKPVKDYDWFFSGQVTHYYRELATKYLQPLKNGRLVKTEGFTQGLEASEYYAELQRARVAPAPSGPETPDSFRLFEALELGCIPIPDERDWKGYWHYFWGEEPKYPVLDSYEQLQGYIKDQVELYPANNNRTFAWWQKRKRQLVKQFGQDIQRLSGLEADLSIDNKITVVIPCSPIKSHPGTSIIAETIDSVRHHLPTAEIIVTFDGVREEQEHRRADYEEAIRQVLWKSNNDWKLYPIIFDEHLHQVGMAREIINEIDTPTILYVEQDTPLVTDYEIPFNKLLKYIENGTSNTIRFHFEAVIPDEHTHLMMGAESSDLLRTMQWSQRPHLASTAYYKRILNDYFSKNANCFIEDKMHGVLHNACKDDGLAGWLQHRVHIYTPDDKNIKRSYHTDGRAGEVKLDNTQVF